jgi:prevent-host-death family protein
MVDVNLADAKARFSQLVNRVAAGETVQIVKHGKRVAKLVAAEEPKRPIDLAALRELTSAMPRQAQSAGEFIREMRDEDRY